MRATRADIAAVALYASAQEHEVNRLGMLLDHRPTQWRQLACWARSRGGTWTVGSAPPCQCAECRWIRQQT